MAEYNFITIWNVNAPLHEIWEVIEKPCDWSKWWKGVLQVHELKKGNGPQKDGVHSHTWQSAIPYKLHFVTAVTNIVNYKSIEANVSGELEGTGKWEFTQQANDWTVVTYYWNVKTNKWWMNFTAPFLSGIFKWSHNKIMSWGAIGLGKKLNCKVRFKHN